MTVGVAAGRRRRWVGLSTPHTSVLTASVISGAVYSRSRMIRRAWRRSSGEASARAAVRLGASAWAMVPPTSTLINSSVTTPLQSRAARKRSRRHGPVGWRPSSPRPGM